MQALRRENVEKPVKNVQMYDYRNCVFGSIEKPSQVKKKIETVQTHQPVCSSIVLSDPWSMSSDMVLCFTIKRY